jgi:rare lipoprotein A
MTPSRSRKSPKLFLLPASVIVLRAVALLVIVSLSACGTTARREAPLPPTMETTHGGAYYLDDGPGDNPPANLDSIPDAVPKLEPIHRGASRPYTVMGRDYMPMTALARYKARGTATWYGRRYHGKKTSSGEIYDMYAMTAAHTTLPIPSYARVTNLANGKSVVVRINDRGPFIGDRVIDLSYTAAYKLGLLAGGSAMVEVESILPGDPAPAKVAVAATPAASAPPDAVPQAAAKPLPIQAAAPEPAPIAVPLPAPEASPPAPATAAPAAEPRAANGVYVQFGAFRLRENAESYLARLKQQFGWLAARLHVAPRDGLYRVHAGPYPNQTEARHIANRIGDSLGPRPILLHW